jgi:hypothetical protein
MKITLTLLLLISSIPLLSRNRQDSTARPLLLTGSIDITNNGISPVPAFSLGKPAVMTAFSLQKNKFSFTHQFNYGIDGKPWSSNNWFRFQFPWRKFIFRAGTNWSLFFKQSTIVENNQTITVKRVNRYSENELAVFYEVNDHFSIQAMWWHDEGLDVDAVKRGDFWSLATEINTFPGSSYFNLKLRPNLFYLRNKIPFQGLFVSNKTTLTYKQLPLSIFFQAVQPLAADGSGKFTWNIGLNYSFNNE